MVAEVDYSCVSLAETLAGITESLDRRIEPALLRLFGEFLDHLARSGLTEASLKPGDRMPDFILPSAEGGLTSSEELLSEGPLVISFFRGHWCPYCNAELLALQSVLPDIREIGATLVAITPELGGLPLKVKRGRNLGYEVLADPDNGVGLAFGVVYRVPDNVLAGLRQLGFDVESYSDGALLPIPATYIVARDGLIDEAFVDPDYRRRMEPARIVDRLRALA